jgi:hypothetical protein
MVEISWREDFALSWRDFDRDVALETGDLTIFKDETSDRAGNLF